MKHQIPPIAFKSGLDAVIIRTNSKRCFKKKPGLFGPKSSLLFTQTLKYFKEKGIKHLLCDIPSWTEKMMAENYWRIKRFLEFLNLAHGCYNYRIDLSG